MKTGIKVFLGFATGLGIGGVTAAVVSKKHYEDELYNEIIPEIKESYEDRLDALEDKIDELEEINASYVAFFVNRYGSGAEKPGKSAKNEETEPENEEKSEKVKVKPGKKTQKKAKIDTNKVDYTNHYNPIDVDDENRVKFDMKPKKDHGLKVDAEGHVYSNAASKGKPFIISIDEYTDLNGYDKQTFTYWAYDEVFTDEHEDPDLNIVMYIGHDLMDLWEEYSPDHESLYIRNPQQKTDYEVIVREQSYADYMREPDFDE